jgi:hypothetical protein
LELNKEQVIQAMREEKDEEVREHFVWVDGRIFPPKQVFAKVTGWERQSFTSLEARRVLTKLGFKCDRLTNPDGADAILDSTSAELLTLGKRVAALELDLTMAKQAIVSLTNRLDALEAEG